MSDHYLESVTERLQLATGDTSFRQIGELTNTHPETVRRYMNGKPPSAAFLSATAISFGVSGEWLLTGRGPMLTKDVESHILHTSTTESLLLAMSKIFDGIFDKLSDLEQIPEKPASQSEQKIQRARLQEKLNQSTNRV